MAYWWLVIPLLIAGLVGGGYAVARRRRLRTTVAPQAPTFQIIRRWSPDPATPSPRRPGGPGRAVGFEVTATWTNPIAKCLLTGQEVQSCTCERHRVG